jgi:acetyl esterase/lipase
VSFCASVATALDIMVVHPCPRLVHEVKYPTTHHDAWDAIEWILEHAGGLGGDLSNLVIGGVSSGANLAAYVTQQFSALGKGTGIVRLKGQVLVVPWLVQPEAFPYHLFVDANKTSLFQCSEALGLSTERVKWLSGNLEADDISDTPINPPFANEKVLSSLPKTAIIAAGGDPLRDDALLYATRLKQAG